MKPLLFAIGVAGLLLGLVDPAPAHVGNRVLPIFELTDADVALIDITDGSVEDWEEVVGEPTFTALDCQTYPDDAGYDPADMDFRVWLAWHRSPSHIYIAMERTDDNYLNEFDRATLDDEKIYLMPFHDSNISFGVDADHSGGKYQSYPAEGKEEADARKLITNQQAQWYTVIGEVPGTGTHVEMAFTWFFADWFSYPPYADGGGTSFGQQPTISVTEAYVTPFDRFLWNNPEESVVSELSPGIVIGLLFYIPDRDEGEGSHGRPAFHHILPGYAGDTSDDFMDALLLGPGGEIPDDSAVGSVTWGRIKARFVD